jgi:alanine racemase
MSDEDLRRPNVFEIDLGAVAHNLDQVRRAVGPATRIFAALKADAYGFGLGAVAEVVAAGGGDAIAVADVADAVALRARGIDLPILLYAGNLAGPREIAAVEAYGLTPTILDRAGAAAYSAALGGRLGVFVKVDVGLERLGVAPEQAGGLIDHIRALPNLELRGLYTHLDVPAGPDVEGYLSWQLGRYRRLCEELEGRGVEVPLKMVASSAVLRATSEANLDAVDPGHFLFGLLPPGPARLDLDLKPAFRALKSRLIHTRQVDRSEFRELAPIEIRDGLRIGVLPIGLRDGMASLTCGEVLVEGRRAAILGPLSLEHTRVDLTEVPAARVGDEVVIIGAQRGASITPAEVIEHQGLALQPALAMAVRPSVRRSYLR